METEESCGGEGVSGAEALAREFCRLGVADRNELINKMKEALGSSLCPEAAAFYLDMNDWNLQAAIGCYLDLRCTPPPEPIVLPAPPDCYLDTLPAPPNSFQDALPEPVMQYTNWYNNPETMPPTSSVPCMCLLDPQPREDLKIPPGVNFEWVWNVMNNGDNAWPEGCWLRLSQRYLMFEISPKSVLPLAPGNVGKIAVNFVSPSKKGIYQQQYRICTPQGLPFGETLWISIVIESDEITEQPPDMITDHNMC